MNLNRRKFMLGAATVAVAASPLVAVAEATLAAPLPEAPVIVHSITEYYGGGDFGDFMGVYARGHIDPARFVGGIDMDDLISLMGEPEGEDDGEDEDLVLIARAEAVLPGQVRHGYARLTNINPEWDEETDDDETWFVTCLPEAEGAFPVTMIGDL